MSKNSPSPPTPPNPTATAAQQAQYNQAAATQTAELNRVNQANAYGSSDYQITGYNSDGTPIYSQSTSFSPGQQQLYNSQLGNQIAQGNAATGFQSSLANLPNNINNNIVYGVTNGSANPGAVNQAEQAAFNTQEQFLQPIQQQQSQQLQDQLVNQGLQPGTQAYNNAMQVLQTGQNQQTQAALNSAVTAGQQEQNTLYGQGIQGANLQNTAQAQQLGELLGSYNSLESTAAPTTPTFSSVPTSTVAAPNYENDVSNEYQGELNTYDAQMGAQNSLTSGLFGLGGAAIQGLATYLKPTPTPAPPPGSDRRIKKNIEDLGVKTPGGHKVYAFDYKKGYEDKAFKPFGFGSAAPGEAGFKLFALGGRTHDGKHIGVMAQEVEKTQPEAVMRDAKGIRHVDYAKVA